MRAQISTRPSKACCAGPVSQIGLARALPVYAQRTAGHMYLDVGAKQSEAAADCHRRTGTGAAGQRLANAALVDTQPDLCPSTICMKPTLTWRGKRATGLQRAADAFHRRALERLGTRSTACGLPIDTAPNSMLSPPALMRVARRWGAGASNGSERDRNWAHPCPPIRDHRSARAPAARRRRYPSSACRFAVALAALMQQRGDTARAIAALFDLTAVGVENAVEHVGAVRRGGSSTSA
jgi:hypothetical protein